MPTVSRIKAVHALLNKNGLIEEKRNIISTFTEQRTDSARAMTDHEADILIRHLQHQDTGQRASDKMRKKILSMAHELNWRLPASAKIDMDRVNNWCIAYGQFHKPLDKHTYAELPALVSQFESMYRKFIKAL